jgi:hypothetical protein
MRAHVDALHAAVAGAVETMAGAGPVSDPAFAEGTAELDAVLHELHELLAHADGG